MINVGREFVLDKSRWKSYAEDYFIAMATAALPWFMIAIYYVFILLPPNKFPAHVNHYKTKTYIKQYVRNGLDNSIPLSCYHWQEL